jgi:hypothetical protein
MALGLQLLSACDDSTPKTVIYTLYQNSSEFAGTRSHVATFDAAKDKDYNRTNCEILRELLASQQGVTVRYWCERGRFAP